MFLDSEVERLKFAEETQILERNKLQLRSIGAFVIRAEQPEIDVLFVSRKPVGIALAVPTGDPTQLQAAGVVEFHNISARSFGVRFELTDYDQRAPSLTFRDPHSWELSPHMTLPAAQIVEQGKQPQLVLLNSHPATKQPFLCIRGVREYHEHPQHDGDDWFLYRESINVYALVERIAEVAVASVRPLMLLPVNLMWHPEARQ